MELNAIHLMCGKVFYALEES